MPLVSGLPLAGVAYLIAQGATRLEAEQVLERIESKPVPLTLVATLDVLDSELLALRAR